MEEAVIDENSLDEILLNDKLNTHEDIQHSHNYHIRELKNLHSIVEVDTQRCQKIDSRGYIYSGDILSAASFGAIISVNDNEFILSSANIDLFNPIKDDGVLRFEANVEIDSSIKKIVNVSGSVNGIEFLKGSFSLLKIKGEA